MKLLKFTGVCVCACVHACVCVTVSLCIIQMKGQNQIWSVILDLIVDLIILEIKMLCQKS